MEQVFTGWSAEPGHHGHHGGGIHAAGKEGPQGHFRDHADLHGLAEALDEFGLGVFQAQDWPWGWNGTSQYSRLPAPAGRADEQAVAGGHLQGDL
jgi:hypothetical protein